MAGDGGIRWLTAILVVMLLALQYRLWVADGGVREVWQLRKQLAAQVEENRHLEERNAALAAEVEDLKSGLAEVEERARSDLGMLREGETFYQVVDARAARDDEAGDK